MSGDAVSAGLECRVPPEKTSSHARPLLCMCSVAQMSHRDFGMTDGMVRPGG